MNFSIIILKDKKFMHSSLQITNSPNLLFIKQSQTIIDLCLLLKTR
ncbi:5233_t:CDS:2 [Funneliformis mosseae]|uniref:5233_t:CDS:1 n=1 Tax=Funneliformis mosseae TaxID=27381 RepID=A0A9N9F4K7_FUNMO|nr:5233_t:CDS:2 [Funneliformis mosseae]